METNHREFIHQMRNLIQNSKVPEGEVMAKLSLILTGPAKTCYYDLLDDQEAPATWIDWEAAICAFHETDTWREWLRKKIKNFTFPDKEKDPAEFLSKFRAWLAGKTPLSPALRFRPT